MSHRLHWCRCYQSRQLLMRTSSQYEVTKAAVAAEAITTGKTAVVQLLLGSKWRVMPPWLPCWHHYCVWSTRGTLAWRPALGREMQYLGATKPICPAELLCITDSLSGLSF
jgi:hypothetical protein